MHSPDLSQGNIAKLRELFPGCVTEAHDARGQLRLAVDFDQLRQELSGHIVEGPQERYRLDWPGKREALALANEPINKTLRPILGKSSKFDTTKNLFIEGDNLEVLKLIRDSYLGCIKVIYIDPPYNTGNDYVYQDSYTIAGQAYKILNGEVDDLGNRMVSNPRSEGRFHSNWLSMLYPRLRIAKHLLAEDGVILISLDDNEQHNARRICDEVFGENAFVGVFSWRSRTAKADVPFGVSNDVEWIIAYANPYFLAGRPGERRYYKSDDFEDRWRLQDLTTDKSREERPNSYFTMVNPSNGCEFPASERRTWCITQDTFSEHYERNKIVFPGDYKFLRIRKPAFRVFENEDRAKALDKYGSESPKMSISTYLPENQVGRTEHGSKEVYKLFDGKVFSYPKPTALINFFLENIDDPEAIVLDFFCGSGTTAEAVLKRNAADGGQRKFIVVQLPEQLDPSSSSQKTAYNFCKENGLRKDLAALAQERIRRASKKILEGKCHPDWNRDVGFRVLKVDTSNMKYVYYCPDKLNQSDLLNMADNVREGRTTKDLLFQVLVDWGMDLTLPICHETVQGKTVFFVDDNALVACFDHGVTEDLVRELAGHRPLRVVFRDNGFVSDAMKINVGQIFRQLSPTTEVKSI